MAVRNALLGAIAAAALVVGEQWATRPANLNLVPLFFPFMMLFGFAAFLLVVVGAAIVFCVRGRFREARAVCLCGGGLAALVFAGLYAQ